MSESYQKQVNRNPLRTAKHRAALKFGSKVRIFPSREDKTPYTANGFKDATTDPRRINAWWNRYPNANPAAPTGEKFWVLDVDLEAWGAGSLEALEAEHGPLPTTYTVKTGGGGMHYYFRVPEGVEIRNSAGKLGVGLDVRGVGGYVLLPGSVTDKGAYEVLGRHPTADAPAWLIKLLREPRKPVTGDNRFRQRSATNPGADGPPIPEGTRDETLASIAGRLHDGTRALPDLEAELLEINVRRCAPPLPERQVLKIARSIHNREPCRPQRRRCNKGVEEVLEAASRFWWGHLVPGGGKSKVRDVYRAYLSIAGRYGEVTTVQVGGEERRAVRFSASMRQASLEANTGVGSACRATRRFRELGAIRKDDANRRDGEAGVFLIIEPAPKWNTLTTTGVIDANEGRCSTSARPPRPDALQTPCPRWGGPVGNARAGTLYALEAFGPQSADELAVRVGIKRPRDLVRRHLEPLAEMGLVESRGDRWALPADYQAGLEELQRLRYSTVRRVKRRFRTPEGRTVTRVVEIGAIASAAERQKGDEERYKRESEAYRNRHRVKPEPVPEKPPAGEVRELERIPEAGPVLRQALGAYLKRNPHRRHEPASWLAVTLWAEERVDFKPSGEQVEAALATLPPPGAVA